MNNNKLIKAALTIKKLADEVRKHLGSGFTEDVHQGALAIEFRNNKIEYLKEVNIEIFYKGHSVGVDRPDFVLTKVGDYKTPIILELKIADKISDGHRLQLKSYYNSFPKNNNPLLKNFTGGILLSIPTGDFDDSDKVKVFVVDQKFNVLRDDQGIEDEYQNKQKEKERLAKEKLKINSKK